MNQEIDAAAEAFVSRAASEDCRGRRSEGKEFTKFKKSDSYLVPLWYRDLLERFELGELCFTAEVEGLDWEASGFIRDGLALVAETEGSRPDIDLANHGYLPFASAEEGDVWVIRSDSSPMDPIFYLSFSDYGPGDPAESPDCLKRFADSFPEFLNKITPTENWG